MGKIHGMMDLGKRSMANSQTALQTVGHNIANRTTEGYSRQRVELQTMEPIGTGKLRMGQGARTTAVTRVNNSYLEKQIAKERSSQGYFGGLADAMTRVEQVYNEQMNKGLNTYVSDFFNSYREFSNNPESLAGRTQVRESADALAKDFNRVHSQLVTIQGDLDQQISTHVDEVNDLASEVASLNEKIQLATANGAPGNDERDRRDLVLKKLGEKINIRWGEGADGSVTVTAGQSALLVVSNESKKLHVLSTPEDDLKSEGGFDIYIKNSDNAEPQKITRQLTGGAIGGCLEIRDGMIQELKEDANQMAFSLARTVNEVHAQGYDQYGRKAGAFFDLPSGSTNAAALIGVNDLVAADPGRIAAGLEARSPGDNRIATQISRLQFDATLNDGTNTFDEFYNSMVGKVGIQTKRAAAGEENQKNVVAQLTNIRESISGVSLDEEATKMIEFQKAFDASARLIRTADEMFDTVLSLKKL